MAHLISKFSNWANFCHHTNKWSEKFLTTKLSLLFIFKTIYLLAFFALQSLWSLLLIIRFSLKEIQMLLGMDSIGEIVMCCSTLLKFWLWRWELAYLLPAYMLKSFLQRLSWDTTAGKRKTKQKGPEKTLHAWEQLRGTLKLLLKFKLYLRIYKTIRQWFKESIKP